MVPTVGSMIRPMELLRLCHLTLRQRECGQSRARAWTESWTATRGPTYGHASWSASRTEPRGLISACRRPAAAVVAAALRAVAFRPAGHFRSPACRPRSQVLSHARSQRAGHRHFRLWRLAYRDSGLQPSVGPRDRVSNHIPPLCGGIISTGGIRSKGPAENSKGTSDFGKAPGPEFWNRPVGMACADRLPRHDGVSHILRA